MSEIRIQEVQERAQLMDKLVELLTVGTKWFSDKADAADSRDAIKSKYAPNFQDAWLLERQY